MFLTPQQLEERMPVMQAAARREPVEYLAKGSTTWFEASEDELHFLLDPEVQWRVKAKSANLNKETIDKMVDAFLAWPLPRSLRSDLCVTPPDYPHPRSGTNLMTADEARQMFEYVMARALTVSPAIQAPSSARGAWQAAR